MKDFSSHGKAWSHLPLTEPHSLAEENPTSHEVSMGLQKRMKLTSYRCKNGASEKDVYACGNNFSQN